MKKHYLSGLIVLLLLFAATTASATVLTFDLHPPNANYDIIPGTYGDRVTSDSDGDGFYGLDYGFTPNVEVNYRTLGYSDDLSFWMFDYGTLENVAYPTEDGLIAELELIADPGYQVNLKGFDMAGYNEGTMFNDIFQVEGAESGILFDGSYLPIPGNLQPPSYFPSDYLESSIIIRWGMNWNIGIDNIAFGQQRIEDPPPPPPGVPEPSTFLLLGAGLFGLAAIGRKRFNQ